MLLPYLHRIDASHWYSNFGPLVREFEERIGLALEDMSGRSLHVTTVNNATVGLELALTVLDLPRGSRVLVPALTFVATASAVHRAGHAPIAGDIDPETWLLTPEIARQALMREQYSAVIPVATFGVPIDVNAWDRFSRETGIPVIVDAAAAYGNQRTFGEAMTVFSLHATKPLSSGEGGFVVSTSSKLIERIRRLTNFGINLGDTQEVPIGVVPQAGTNGKMSEYHAAIGLAALQSWNSNASRRLALFRSYMSALTPNGLEAVTVQAGSEDVVRSTLCVTFRHSRLRNTVMEKLAMHGIATRLWYCPLIPDHPAFKTSGEGAQVAVATDVAGRLLGLPFYPELNESQWGEVADLVVETAG